MEVYILKRKGGITPRSHLQTSLKWQRSQVSGFLKWEEPQWATLIHFFLTYRMLDTLGYSKEFINKEIQPCDKVTADSEQTASRLSCLCAQIQVKPGHTQTLFSADMASVGRELRTSTGGLLPTTVWAKQVAGFHTCLWGRPDLSDCVLMNVNLRVCTKLSIISQI